MIIVDQFDRECIREWDFLLDFQGDFGAQTERNSRDAKVSDS